ncbi:MAG: DUF1501 domain-containing protein [Reinekea sp.]|nr:DUF1501 domain-containing protein [Reinekea sp.]
MNRREFLKNVGASGMVAVAPIALASKASAATDLVPVGKYFVFAHLGGGWEPTTFCNPQGNKLRSTVGQELGMDNGQVRNAGSIVNKYPASAIRRAIDVYAGSASVSADMKYAPYLGTFNRTGAGGVNDDGNANEGLTTIHIQQILSGDIAGGVLTAASSAGFVWKTTKTPAQIEANARAIIEGTVQNVQLNGIETELVDRDLALNGTQMTADLFVYDAFVCLHADQLRVLNGVDNRTNSHSTGTQYADTGSMAMGYPDFSALYAALQGADRPLAWMTDGSGNDSTANLVARSSASDANVFDILADPKRNTSGAPGGNPMTDSIQSYLNEATYRRNALQKQKERLPLRQQFQDQLYLVRDQGSEFTSVANDINNPPVGPKLDIKNAANTGRKRHIRIGAAGFETGMASSMQIGFGTFDTHGNHDQTHFNSIRAVLYDLHFLFRALEAHGVKDQTTVIVGSDFGRTPWYNDGDGKDHWAVTSYMLMGNGVAGGTSVNATNGLVEALNVDGSMQPVSAGGIRMTASHIHRELRKFAGIDNNPITLQFPVEAEDMNILG